MINIKLPIFQRIDQNDLKTFISFWSKFYSYPLENLYTETITKTTFNENDIQRLFIWKNGMNLSERKQNSLDTNIKAKLELINSYKINNNFTINEFLKKFNGLSVVWKIFLLHIIKPQEYPIYDQHVHRTYNFIHQLPYKTNSVSNQDKENFYFKIYSTFILGLNQINLKKLDEAFFLFGKFIKINKNENLFI